jgi:endonuclease/exonuclease/phosphatase family metal-dependent hydrolase
LKLITWNIQSGRGLDGRLDLARIVSTARGMADFDVLCVQEVADNFPAVTGGDTGNQFAQLGALLPGFHCAAGYGVDVPAGEARRRRFGNAVFSRYDMLGIRRHALPWPADPGKESMPRVAVEAVVQAPMGAVRITTTHLEYYSDLQRRAQAHRLRAIHDEMCHRSREPGFMSVDRGPFTATPQPASAILAGDFNFPPENPAYAEIQGPLSGGGPRYRDPWPHLEGNRPHAPTFCVHDRRYSKTPYCCDFVFVSEDLLPRVRRTEVDTATQASDHQPVLIEIDDR